MEVSRGDEAPVIARQEYRCRAPRLLIRLDATRPRRGWLLAAMMGPLNKHVGASVLVSAGGCLDLHGTNRSLKIAQVPAIAGVTAVLFGGKYGFLSRPPARKVDGGDRPGYQSAGRFGALGSWALQSGGRGECGLPSGRQRWS